MKRERGRREGQQQKSDSMNLHEYQAKALLAEYAIPVPPGIAVFSVSEALAAAEKLGSDTGVVNAQSDGGGAGMQTTLERTDTLRDALRNIDINRITPLESLAILNRLKGMIDN